MKKIKKGHKEYVEILVDAKKELKKLAKRFEEFEEKRDDVTCVAIRAIQVALADVEYELSNQI
jgi:hypothetical protein